MPTALRADDDVIPTLPVIPGHVITDEMVEETVTDV